MKLSTTQTLVVAALVSVHLCACSQGGFSVDANNTTTQASQGATSGSSTSTANQAELQKLDMQGLVFGGSLDQSLAIDLDKSTGEVILQLPMSSLGSLNITSLEVPTAKGIKVGLETNSLGILSLSVRIPSKYILKGISTLPAGKLPNGDALPQIAGGELPSVGVSFTNSGDSRLYLYVGVEVVAIFVETTFDPYIKLTLPIKNKAGTKIFGYLTLVPEKSGSNGGIFLSLKLPTEISRILDDHFGSL